tara:strand:- start:4493 stop:4714 length:222 start_codon:yes stop_codon:yes gene_type:complete
MEYDKIKDFFSKTLVRIPLGVIFGGSLGYTYFYFIGCNSGSCAITTDPVNSIAYGSLVGLIIFWLVKNKKEKS